MKISVEYKDKKFVVNADSVGMVRLTIMTPQKELTTHIEQKDLEGIVQAIKCIKL